MSITYDKAKLGSKAALYCERNDSRLTQELGFGTQGVVFRTAHNTALKVYGLSEGYFRERRVYLRLRERKIQEIQGLSIQRIVNWDDELYAFEMTIVAVPCLLDFGGAYVDRQPEHMLRDEAWHDSKMEEFADTWLKAQSVIKELEYRAEIFLADVNPGNIKFA